MRPQELSIWNPPSWPPPPAQTTRPPWRTIFRFNGDYVAFPGKLSKRLKVSREGLPLETPTSPGFANFQSALFLEQWPQLLPRPRQAHWLENSGSPLPRQTPWQLGLEPKEPRGPATQGGHCLRWQNPRLCATHNSYPHARKGPAATPHSSRHPLWSFKPSCPRCAIPRQLAGGPGVPRATRHQITSCCWQSRTCPILGGVLATYCPLSPPRPKHRLWFQLWGTCSSGERRPPSPLQSYRRTLSG